MRKLSDNNDDATSGRLDMLVANAALTFPTQDILSPDGVERTFAVNCLGHFVFITTLLGELLLNCGARSRRRAQAP
jgi:NAD(P)-dependent dehydrogenase (short-subunit alcohol dehydrogenase family)